MVRCSHWPYFALPRPRVLAPLLLSEYSPCVTGRNKTSATARPPMHSLALHCERRASDEARLPERWQHVARIYELAVDQAAATRDKVRSERLRGRRRRCGAKVESSLRQEAAQSRPGLADLGHRGTIVPRCVPTFAPAHRPGPVPRRRPSRRRRHGRSLPRAPTPVSIARWQSKSFPCGAATRSADARPVRPRSEGGCCADPPAASARCPRRRASRPGRLPRHGAPRG